MSDRRKWLGASLIAAGFAAALLALLRPLPSAAADPVMDRKVEQIVVGGIAPLLPENGAGGVAVAVRIGGHTLFFNYGLADLATKRSIDTDSLFNIASVRKLFEAALLAEGVERGELKFDDPVNKYIGELQGDYIRRVTIGELGAHTSGLLLPTDHPPWPNESYSRAEFLGMLNAWTPQHGEQPGRQRIYTHAGYVLLQLVLERRYGLPIGELIKRRILAPLGMHSTLVPERGPDNRAVMDPQLLRRTVQGYAENGMPIGPPGGQQTYYDFPGTGQMFSSARDLVILLGASLGDTPVAPALRAALKATQQPVFRVDAQHAQGLAWEILTSGGPIIVDKLGGLNNASAYIGLMPEQRAGIVILSNRGDVYPFEAARATILPELARLSP